jgi:hypothetical protein
MLTPTRMLKRSDLPGPGNADRVGRTGTEHASATIAGDADEQPSDSPSARPTAPGDGDRRGATKRWIVIANCQAYGLAECILSLARDVDCHGCDL